ncbi:autophagy protein 6 [Entomortierella beljakovae]|nr:autophagy protein 6 [Entomortierella beljakovae]
MSVYSKRHFVCQKCNQQLVIEESLQDINSAAADLLLGPLTDQNGNGDGASGDRQPSQHNSIAHQRRNDNTTSDTSYPEAVFTRTIPPHTHSPASRLAKESNPHSSMDASESFIVLPKGKSSDLNVHNTITNQGYYSRGSISHQGTTSSTNSGVGSGSSTVSPTNGNQYMNTKPTINRLRSPTNGAGDDTGSMHIDRNTKSNRLRTTGKLFDLMSSKSDIDHPLCHECAEMLLDSLAKQLRDVSRERDCYIEFLRTVNSNVASDAEMEELENEIKQIQIDEDTSIQALLDIEEQQKAVREEIAMLEKESLELDKEEERYWQECNDFQLALQSFHNERDSVNLKYDYDSRQLEKLHKTNVYNDTFNISYDGNFATINGFRLGRLSNEPVEWAEINAAWGQTLLLLHTIANKLNFTFKTYRLVPLGSFSRIDKIEGDRASYELYGSGEFRMLLNRRFDNAMIAFLNCLQQLGDYAEQQESKLELPYKYEIWDRIGDLSIRYQFQQGETWTRALKYTLTNTKWILAYASSSTSMTTYTPSTPSLPTPRRSSPAVKSSGSTNNNIQQ